MTSDALPITVLVPEDLSSPVEIYDQHAALKLAVVERAAANNLGPEWDQPGVYLLLDRHDADGRWGVYVGKAPAGIRNRILDHQRKKDHWYRAVLIRRDTTYGFNSAQAGWLEGRLYGLMAAAEDAVLNNGNQPQDETLPPYDRQMLEMVVLPVQRILRVLGLDTSTVDERPTESAGRTRTSRFVGITLGQIVEEGLITVGTTLVSLNGAWPATATVGFGGTVDFKGVNYPTPSAAASAAKDGGAANGWDFWAVEGPNGRTPLAVLRAELLAIRDNQKSNA